MSNQPLIAAQEIHDRLIAWRRHFHAHPELGEHEEQTARYVAEELRRMGYEPRERFGGTFGVVADLRPPATSSSANPAIALRADMDALPIQEETGVEYASQNPGLMHACGHDAHVAMLLGAARLLGERRTDLKRGVRLIFQPAEEGPGGAAPMIAAGVLDGIEAVFGLHIWSEMPLGTLGTRPGAFMSSTNRLRIIVHGKGGHAAMPHQCVDPVVAAAQIILALQTVVSRGIAMTDSAVVSVTCLQAGSASNIIPELAELRGTVRTLSQATRATVLARIRQLAAGVAAAHGATADVTLEDGYPALVNDPGVVDRALRAARQIGFTPDQLVTMPAQGGAEDFAYYALKVPAAFLFLGARNEAKGCTYPHHHPRFNIDEDALPLGAALFAAFADA
jgi:amidohydrolase